MTEIETPDPVSAADAVKARAVEGFNGHRVSTVGEGISAVIQHYVSPVIGMIRLDDKDGRPYRGEAFKGACDKAASDILDALAAAGLLADPVAHADPEVRSYLSDLIDTNDDGQEVEFGYDPDVRERAIAWLQTFDQH